jgi:CheY-like chemotaxis protein
MDHSPALKGLRLLVVEDEPLAALELQDMLDACGCQVVGVASNLLKGLAIACNEQQPLDGAVLDINLGGEQVYPVAERLKTRGVPFIFSTGYGRSGRAPSFAHIPTLNKPYGPEELEEMLVTAFVSGPPRQRLRR